MKSTKLIFVIFLSLILITSGIFPINNSSKNSVKAANIYNPFKITIKKATYLYKKSGNKLVRYKYASAGRIFTPITRSSDYFVIRPYSTSYYIPVSDAELNTNSIYMSTLTSGVYERLIQEFYTRSNRGEKSYIYNQYSKDKLKEYADSAIKGNWKLLAYPHDVKVENLDEFDWRHGLPYVNSYLFQLNYLMVVEQLTQAYKEYKNPEYLIYAREVIKDWHEDFPIEGYRSYKWGYNDHGTAIRTFILIDFWNTYKNTSLNNLHESEFANEIMTMFYEHGWLLNLWSFYRPNNNHGMFQDLALLAISETYPDLAAASEWKNTAKDRLMDQIEHGISIDGLHMEHSPMYQHYIYTSLIGFVDWAEQNKFELPNEMIRRVKEMPRNLTYLTKPNGVMPIFGDSPATLMTPGIVPYASSYPEMVYAMTSGEDGGSPSKNAVNLSDQYAIFRQHWGEEKPFDQSIFFGMTSGFHSTAHKHPDDLSIELYGFGGDYIVETGRYAYITSDERREALSTAAHNVVQVEGTEFSLDTDNIGKSKIEDVNVKSNGTLEAVGSHSLTPGIVHRRRVLYDKNKTFLISDTVKGTYTRNYIQRFHLAPEFTVEKNDVRLTVAKHPSGRTLSLIQVYAPTLITPNKQTSHVSYKDYTWTPRTQLTYEQKHRSVRFMTLIHLGENNGDILTDAKVTRDGDIYTVHYQSNNDTEYKEFNFTSEW
ncbi:hypothetical protein JOC86_002309 [Bacillus pakistanensis]|uniref:Heparin-sulfate lyase N-terminal domain-containing protein n=1 Tax=Rossellomorea pakistanensis TaxID=992288 RepID=A0ABS2ND30_9BACI|nr:alginate lyase family protein [Bacillus pakistanensis]MBM7585767.1 hypothetical protein [Bacillus pakistanensis]